MRALWTPADKALSLSLVRLSVIITAASLAHSQIYNGDITDYRGQQRYYDTDSDDTEITSTYLGESSLKRHQNPANVAYRRLSYNRQDDYDDEDDYDDDYYLRHQTRSSHSLLNNIRDKIKLGIRQRTMNLYKTLAKELESRIHERKRTVPRGVRQSVCDSIVGWRKLRTAISINNTAVQVFQPRIGQPGQQWFYTVKCNQSATVQTQSNSHRSCRGIDNQRFTSECITRKAFVLALVKEASQSTYNWNWIQVNRSCNCAIIAINTET